MSWSGRQPKPQALPVTQGVAPRPAQCRWQGRLAFRARSWSGGNQATFPIHHFFPFSLFPASGRDSMSTHTHFPYSVQWSQSLALRKQVPNSAHTHRPVPEPGKPSPTSCLPAPHSSCRVFPQYELLSQPALAAPLRSLKHSFLPGAIRFS